MSNFLDSLQVELIFSLIIMVVMAIFFIYAGKKFATADPTARPKGVVLVVETGAIKKQGLLSYIWGAVWPPTNLLSILSPLISLSMRLFGNILSGSILMYLVYQLTGYISGLLINFNFLGPVIAPWLHCYFDVFAGCIQTLVFVTLSSILIMMENPD